MTRQEYKKAKVVLRRLVRKIRPNIRPETLKLGYRMIREGKME
jgi:hypothetical protein